jgi:signal transduction histidine kinase
MALALALLAAYFWREHTRELREAAQRVTFVNQVSHELKTPLTNIRIYAEMMEDGLDDKDAEGRRRVGVIVQESRRLGRMISNILTFSRKERNGLRIRKTAGVVDEIVAGTIDNFRPALDARKITIAFEGDAKQKYAFDADALEQIVGNLINNVEKYAPGCELTISTRQTDGRVTITIADTGPGIPPGERAKIFRPFHRVSDRLTDGVAGTGIGLSIARDLARLHGGDLILKSGDGGATFVLTMTVELET